MKINTKTVALVNICICICAVCSSLFASIFLKHSPCFLCLMMRYGFCCVAICALLTLYRQKAHITLFVASFCLLVLAFYSLGVENHWFASPAFCHAKLEQTVDEILNNTNNDCTNITWKLFGLSSTLYSFVITAILFWINSIVFFAKYVQVHDRGTKNKS